MPSSDNRFKGENDLVRPAEQGPFGLDLSFQSRWRQALFAAVRPILERVFALDELERRYKALISNGADSRDFLTRVVEELGISTVVPDGHLERIPKSGPLVMVANHPFGGIEGIILAQILKAVRPDVKIMANFLLSRVPEMREHLLFVDPFGSDRSAKKNITPLREAIRWVEAGKMLVVFPAGAVSHLQWSERAVTDPEWSTTVARVIRRTECPVVPLFFHGRNGALFQLLGLVHPTLRTAMLPTELLNKQNASIELSVGRCIPFEKLSHFQEDIDLLSYLRLRTYILGSGKQRQQQSGIQVKHPRLDSIAPAQDHIRMAEEVVGLPTAQRLLESGEHQVYYAQSWQIPTVLQEIGRLREISFRLVSEGTGRSLDLDHFDRYYTHLFVWNRVRNDVVGAYRIGHSDQILANYGLNGFYTSTLFAYRSGLLEQIGPALELGRSFVRPDYQKSYTPLLLLWKGIGQYVVRNPRYKILFGPVSINNDYDSMSRDIIVNFLKANDFLPTLARLVKPRNPARISPVPRYGGNLKAVSVVARDIEEVGELVREIEADQRNVPVLLRQYLKLGGKLLGFNIDEDFGDVLDGLILIDLTQTDSKLLERYLGKQEAADFLAVHGLRPNIATLPVKDRSEVAAGAVKHGGKDKSDLKAS